MALMVWFLWRCSRLRLLPEPFWNPPTVNCAVTSIIGAQAGAAWWVVNADYSGRRRGGGVVSQYPRILRQGPSPSIPPNFERLVLGCIEADVLQLNSSEYSFESFRRDLHNTHFCTDLRSQNVNQDVYVLSKCSECVLLESVIMY